MIQQGTIVWVRIADPSGENHKCRPAVVLTPTEEIDAVGQVVVAAASTRFEEPLPVNKIKLPWHNNKHPVTGLKKPTVVVCDWLVTIDLNQVEAEIGSCPQPILYEILSKLPT